MKFVQDLASESVRFSGESTALGIGEANAPPTQVVRHRAAGLPILRSRRSNFWTLRD
jgi:hypothetical protein